MSIYFTWLIHFPFSPLLFSSLYHFLFLSSSSHSTSLSLPHTPFIIQISLTLFLYLLLFLLLFCLACSIFLPLIIYFHSLLHFNYLSPFLPPLHFSNISITPTFLSPISLTTIISPFYPLPAPLMISCLTSSYLLSNLPISPLSYLSPVCLFLYHSLSSSILSSPHSLLSHDDDDDDDNQLIPLSCLLTTVPNFYPLSIPPSLLLHHPSQPFYQSLSNTDKQTDMFTSVTIFCLSSIFTPS